MQFDDETFGQNSDSQSNQEVVPLRREVAVVERQRNALLAGVLSIAGIAFGFGLGQFAANSNAPHTVIVHTGAQSATQSSHCAPVSDTVTWLGVVVESQPGSLGAHIKSVFRGSPAETAGLEAGMRIVSLGNSPVRSARELIREVRSHRAGDRATIRVNSVSGQREARTVVLGQLSTTDLQRLLPRRH